MQSAACDILVIGGGPAGSTIAALLAGKGRSVVVVEKDRHPRFHIGESLLPLNLPLFDRLGVRDEVAAIGMIKHGAEFNSPEHGCTSSFDFADAFDKRCPYAYQVRRSEFDHLLLNNAGAKGAEVHEGVRVNAADFSSPEHILVSATADDGVTRQWRTRYLVDASGRDTFLAAKAGIKRRNPKHASAALYGHFENARRLDGREEGNISMFWFPHGWFWFIPLRDGTTSVGAVCWPYYFKQRKTDPTAFFLDTIKLSPELADRLKDARLTAPATATGNYSYAASRMTGDRHLMIGDAYAFVDPVFSSGVYLAMASAFDAAEVVDCVLRDPTTAPRLYRAFERKVRRGLATFTWMIYRMTSPAMRNLIMYPSNVLGIESAVISFLAGDVYRGGPVRRRLYAFRSVYYLSSLAALPTSIQAWWARRHAIRPVDASQADAKGVREFGA